MILRKFRTFIQLIRNLSRIPEIEMQLDRLERLVDLPPSRQFIFDIGVNYGEDSRFYLDKGFHVVGVEANPQIVAALREKFDHDIRSGRYQLINVGIWSSESVLPFYRNLANDHWSSFDPVYGCRDNTPYEEILIPCITPKQLFNRYGIPYYMKIDIEGADKIILEQLKEYPRTPEYISVEEYGVRAIDDLKEVGYRFFLFQPQGNKSHVTLPFPPREGEFIHRDFDGRDSGPFVRELLGDWLPYKAARSWFESNIRREDGTYLGPTGEWYDIHACTAIE